MTKKESEVAVLTFAMGDKAAHVVTNGQAVRTYRQDECKQHSSLTRAIAYLEVLGFQIVPDAFF